MNNQFKVYPFFMIFTFAVWLVSCSDGKNHTKLASNGKDSESKNSASPTRNSIKYISQNALITFVHESHIVEVNKKAGRPFNKLKYNKVIAYDYDGVDGEHVSRIIENNKLVLKIKQQRQLNQKQVDALTYCLGSNSTYGSTYAFCFEPHLGVVFYYNNEIIASISISIGCNFLDSSVPIPATKAQNIAISKKYKYPAKGFSKIGSQELISFTKEMNFTLQ